MPRSPHSDAFLAVRNAILGLTDADRKPLARLYGAMQNPQPDPTAGLITILRAIAALDDADHLRLARWCRRYLNAWGQVPNAPSFEIDPHTRRDVAKKDP